MGVLKQIRTGIGKFLSWFARAIGVIATIVSLLIGLGIVTIVAGSLNHLLLIVAVGIAIVCFSVIFGIIFYVLLRDVIVMKNVSTASPQTIVGSTRPLLPATDTIPFPPPPPEDVEIIRKEIVYEYQIDRQHMTQYKHIKIRVLQESVDRFRDRYRWTGRGTCVISSRTPNFKITNQRISHDGLWNFFEVEFPREYHRNDEVEFTIVWELHDEKLQAIPFLSTMIDRKTEYLLLRVTLPEELAPKDAYFHEYRNYIDTLPIHTEKIYWSPATRCINYEVRNPGKYQKYLIRWHYE